MTLQNPPLFSLHPAMNEILAASKRGKLMIQACFFPQVSCNTEEHGAAARQVG